MTAGRRPTMIYLLGGFLSIAPWHYVRVARRKGGAALARELAITLGAGLLAGVFVAIGARLGMRLIALTNDAPPRMSWHGTSVVFVVYCGVGALCGVLYAAVFRRWVRRSGLGYGGVLVVATWYPLAHSGAQQLVTPPGFFALALWSGAIVAFMWIPYACVFEWLIARWDGTSLP